MTYECPFIVGAMYKTKNDMDVEGFDLTEEICISEYNHLIFIEAAKPTSIYDTWYWVEENRKVKVITPIEFVNWYFDLVSVPE